MIETLSGTVSEILLGKIIVNLSGIGFALSVPARSTKQLKIGEAQTFYTSFFIKEEKVLLYGFLSSQEKEIFDLLLEAPGVGPRIGLAILDALEIEAIVRAIQWGQPNILEAASGVGKKLAQKIVFELESKLKKLKWQTKADTSMSIKGDLNRDLFSALENMGYNSSSIRAVLSKAFKPDASFEENLKNCLKNLTV